MINARAYSGSPTSGGSSGSGTGVIFSSYKCQHEYEKHNDNST